MQEILNVDLDIDKIPLVADENNIIVFFAVYNNEKHIVVVSNRKYIEHERKYKYYIEVYDENKGYTGGTHYLSLYFYHSEGKDFKSVPHKMINISHMFNFNDYIINKRTAESFKHNCNIVHGVLNNITDILNVYSIGETI